MRFSTVFELLLIFLLIAFAAYGRVINRNEVTHRLIGSGEEKSKQGNMGVTVMTVEDATHNLNKYCNCNENICNCCRNFSIPLVALQGPGCASLQYLRKDNLAVQVSFRDNILSSRVIDGKEPRPMCVQMPGGFSKLCGRVYSIEREPDNHFKACLMLELQSSSEIEASLRIRCFRFGPDGLQVRPAEHLPFVEPEKKPNNDDDDYDDDYLGLDDDDDDDDDVPAKNTVTTSAEQTTEEDDEEEDDYFLGFDALVDILTGDDSSEKKKVTTASPPVSFTVPNIIYKPTTNVVSSAPPHKESSTIITSTKIPTTTEHVEATSEKSDIVVGVTDSVEDHQETTTAIITTKNSNTIESDTHVESSTEKTNIPIDNKPLEAASSTKIQVTAKPNRRITVGVPYKKGNGASNSVNAIKNDSPPSKPQQEEDEDDILDLEDLENEEIEQDEEDEDDTTISDNADEDDGDLLDDDEEEDEAEVLSALISDEKNEKKIDQVDAKPEDTDEDYEGLSELLSRRSHRQNRGRQNRSDYLCLPPAPFLQNCNWHRAAKRRSKSAIY